MWGMSTQLELATAIVDRTDALSLLGVGLVGFIWLAVGLIAWMAACDPWSQIPVPMARERWSRGSTGELWAET